MSTSGATQVSGARVPYQIWKNGMGQESGPPLLRGKHVGFISIRGV